MTLLRGFGRLDEDGKVALQRNFMIQMGFEPDSSVTLNVIRIKESSRKPYLVIHRPETAPMLSNYEAVLYQCLCKIDAEKRMVLNDHVIEECDFEPGLTNRLEFKLVGPTNAPWLVIKDRGRRRATSLQEKLGAHPKGGKIKSGQSKWSKKKWRVMEIQY